MRFFAFLCIFFHHIFTQPTVGGLAEKITLPNTFAPSAKFAVSLFFLLSGYLITTLLAIEKESTGQVHLRAFYLRRIARIWPVYYGFIVLVLLIGTIVHRLLPSSQALIAYALFSGNWFMIFGNPNSVGGLGILWSISIEEQFYLVWPLVAMLCNRRGLIRISMGILGVSYAILLLHGAHGSFGDVVLRFDTLVEMQFFAAGALLAVWRPRQGIKLPWLVRLLLGLSGLVLWAVGTRFFGNTAPWIVPQWWMPAMLYGCVLAGCMALFLSFFGLPARFIPQPILWLGKISYGLYVYHVLVLTLMPRWPMIREHRASFAAARICFELLIVILLAGLSYRWLERPFLRWKERITFVPNRIL
jgi:peptidoglycan/LPS O-acetylase OafA/YrhL